MKMALVTFMVVYPLTSALPPLFEWLLPTWHPLVVNIVVTALIVAALTWLIMPFLTRLLARWLFTVPPDPAAACFELRGLEKK